MGLMSPRAIARRTVMVETPSSWAASAILKASRSGLLVAFPGAVRGFMSWRVGCNGIHGRFVFCRWLCGPDTLRLEMEVAFWRAKRISQEENDPSAGKSYKLLMSKYFNCVNARLA